MKNSVNSFYACFFFIFFVVIPAIEEVQTSICIFLHKYTKNF